MSRSRRSLLLLLLLSALALVAVAAGEAAAEERHGDWVVSEYTQRIGEEIVVEGALNVELGGQLYLEGCTVTFEGQPRGSLLFEIGAGRVYLDDTTVVATSPGKLVVDGRLEVTGETRLEQLDVLVSDRGSLATMNAKLTLVGAYTNLTINDPLVLDLGGRLESHDTELVLFYSFVRSTGTVSMERTRVSATADYQLEYDGYGPRVWFISGSATLAECELEDLWHGVLSNTAITMAGTRMNNSDLQVAAQWWQPSLEARLVGCELVSSDLGLAVEGPRETSIELDVLLEDTTFQAGSMSVQFEEHYQGDLVLRRVSFQDPEDAALEADLSGFAGTCLLEGLDVEAPWGLRFSGDFSNVEVLDSIIHVDKTALDFTTGGSTLPASVVNTTVTARTAVEARNAAVSIVGSDLISTAVPVKAASGASVSLFDCYAKLSNIQLHVVSGERPAKVQAYQTFEVASVNWKDGGAIEEGEIFLFTPHPLIPDPNVRWTVGDEMELIKVLEWTRSNVFEIDDDVFHFNHVRPEMDLGSHVFKVEGELIPITHPGPYDLLFVDDLRPEIRLDPSVSDEVFEPRFKLLGTCVDVGTGIDTVSWRLRNSTGELVDEGPVDRLRDGSWRTTIDLTANNQRVTLVARDRAGNEATLTTQNIRVEVPRPVLTLVSPQSGEVTNEGMVHISGRASGYAGWVQIHVVNDEAQTTVPVVGGSFSFNWELPFEGKNELVVTAFDPFGNDVEVRRTVSRDTLAPLLEFDGLDPCLVNYLRSPSLVISGMTDDARADIAVQGQRVGVMADGSFALTVQLPEGRTSIPVSAEDQAGNLEEVLLTVVVDTLPPGLELVSPSANPLYTASHSMEVVVEPSEPLSRLLVDGSEVPVNQDTVARYVNLRHDGVTEVVFLAVDLAGNEAELVVRLHLDTRAPKLTVASPQDGLVLNSSSVQLVAVVDEEGCTLLVDGEEVRTSVRGNWQHSGRAYLLGGDGARTVTVTVVDRAGNTASQVMTVEIDTVKPFIVLDGWFDGRKVTTEPIEVVGRTEPGARVVYVNGEMAALWPDGSFETTVELEEGWQVLNVEVVDRAGNDNNYLVPVRALQALEMDVPEGAIIGGTVLLVMGAMVASTEAGRWGLLTLFVALYTKLRKDRILDQRTRGLIEGYITANPGANYTIIRDNLDLADGTLTYHLQVLEREGFIYSIREGLFRCFYPKGIPPPRRGKLHLSDTQKDIVRITKRIPGITVGEIATAMNRRPNVISYHLKLLREGGLVRMEEDGRHVRVYPVESAVAMI